VAWSTSYIVPSTLVAGLTGTSLNLGTAATDVYIALFGTSTTPNVDTPDPQYYGDSVWTSGNEVTGTNWTAGGYALDLTGAGLTHASGGFMKFAAGNVSQASPLSGTLAASTKYKVAVLNGAGSPAIWNAAVASYWSTGYGGSGLTAGPITVFSNATADSPGQESYNLGATMTYPGTNAGPYSYGLDIEVTPQAVTAEFGQVFTLSFTA